jgi:predicted metal-dependent enzyme (double-stranded beta helix superfamily)
MKDLPNSLKVLIEGLSEKKDINNNYVKEVLLKANIQKEDILPYANFDHDIHESYGRNVVYDGGNFKIMVLSWNPNDFSSIHSHGGIEWGMVKYFGEGQQKLYELEGKRLHLIDMQIMTIGSYEAITGGILHQTGNTSTEPLLTLHIYGSNSHDKKIGEGAEVFDLINDKIYITNGEAFLDIEPEGIINTYPGVEYDKETFMSKAIIRLKYYHDKKDATYQKKMKALLDKMADYYG